MANNSSPVPLRQWSWAVGLRSLSVLLLGGCFALSAPTFPSQTPTALPDNQNDETRLNPQAEQIAAPQQTANFRYALVSKETIEVRLRAAPGRNEDRKPAIESMFDEAGCKDGDLTEQPVKHEKAPNIICRLRGSAASTIIVGAHFDKVGHGGGVVDNWSGASLLPSLFQSLQSQTLKHTFMFVAFTAEESGLAGSEYYAAHLSPVEISQTRAMVNLDTLALGPTEVWLTHSDRKLAGALYAMAKSMKLPMGIVNADQVGDDDSHSFLRRKIPTLMVHSVTKQTLHILHSNDDNLEAVKFEDYYDSYRLLAAYLAWIDILLD